MTLEQAVAYCRRIGPAARLTTDAPAALEPALEAALAPFVAGRAVWMDAAAFIVTARAGAAAAPGEPAPRLDRPTP